MPYKDKEKAKKHAKEYWKKYNQYPKRKVIIKKAQTKFRQSPKGKECSKRFYNLRRLKLHELKINGCNNCGYHKNDTALNFHHIDPKVKKFNLGINCFTKHSEEEIKEELNKCILLCANCHKELHHQKEK